LERTILDSNIEKHLFSQPSLVGKKWLLYVDVDNRMDVCSRFERMEGVEIMLGA
jgi:hypothetical protein